MYHPDMMLNIGHKREAELVRDAEMCGVPKAEPQHQKLSGSVLAVCCVTLLFLTVAWAVIYS